MIYWCQSATSKRFKNSGEDLKDLFSWIKHFAGRKTKLPVVDTRGNYDRWLYLCTWSNCECTVVDGFICVYHMFVWWECGMWCTSGAVRSDGGRKHYPAKETWKVMGDVSVWHFNLCFDFVLFHFVLFFVVVVLCYGHWQRYLLEMQLLPVKPEVPICLSVCAPVCVCVCEIRFSIPANIDVCVRIKEAEISYLLCYTFLLQSQTSVLLADKCVPAQYTFYIVDFPRILCFVSACLQCTLLFLRACHFVLSHPPPTETTGEDSLTGFPENSQLLGACQCSTLDSFSLIYLFE